MTSPAISIVALGKLSVCSAPWVRIRSLSYSIYIPRARGAEFIDEPNPMPRSSLPGGWGYVETLFPQHFFPPSDRA